MHFKHPFKGAAYIILFGFWSSTFLFIAAYNWKLILEFLNRSSIGVRDVFQVYLKSNVAKYLPGNVMHYAGRNYLGNKLGWKHSEMAFSSLLEYVFGAGTTGIIIFLFVAAGLVNIPPQFSPAVDFNRVLVYSAIGSAGGLAIILLLYAYGHSTGRGILRVASERIRRRAKQFFSASFLALNVKLFLISLLCFFLNSLFYFYLCDLVLDFHIKQGDILSVYSALAIANHSAIVTPGVPGGFGVKESISFLLISAYGYPWEPLMISILAYRVVCVLGDFISFLIALFFRGDS